MKTIKKLICTPLVACFVVGFGFSKEKLDENLRFELNVSDSFYTRILSFGNMTDIGVDITSLDNNLGGRLGLIVRETVITSSNGNGVTLSLSPYIGITFLEGACLMGGVVFYPGLVDSVGPYLGFNWDVDLIPVKPGLSNSLALRLGVDWYIELYNTGDGATDAFASICSVLFPNVSVGLTYKLGYGMKIEKKGKAVESTSAIEILDEGEVPEEFETGATEEEVQEESSVPDYADAK